MTDWLIDKSALVRLGQSPDAGDWITRIERGLVRVSTVTLLEIGYSARGLDDVRRIAEVPPVSLMPVESITPAAEVRACELQVLLAHRGQHRSASVPDLLLAAIAKTAGLTVLHVDKNFDLIASVSGCRVERLRLS